MLMSCKAVDSRDSTVSKACTLVGSAYAIRAEVTSSSSLPPNLAVALNGNDVDVDECSPAAAGSLFGSSIQVNDDRTRVSIVFQLNPASEDYAFYFPNESEQPASDLMALRLFSRPTCNNGHSLYQDLTGAQISWKPVYANGEGCGVTSYSADSELAIQ